MNTCPDSTHLVRWKRILRGAFLFYLLAHGILVVGCAKQATPEPLVYYQVEGTESEVQKMVTELKMKDVVVYKRLSTPITPSSVEWFVIISSGKHIRASEFEKFEVGIVMRDDVIRIK